MHTILFSLIVLSSFLLSYSLKRIFISLNKFDAINHRSIHKSKATKSGGIAIFLTIFIFSFYYYIKSIELFDFSILIPLGIMFIVGVYDDFYNADFKLKFLLQIIVAKILIDYGLLIDNFHGIFGFYELPRLASQIFTVFVFLVVVNAFNFIDGIDGLAMTESIKVILIIELISKYETPFFYLGIITILAAVPLYYFNFKRNYKVFLGDAGSLFLGTLVSIYIFYLLGSEFSFANDLELYKPLFAMSLIAYPLIDLLRVFIIRLKNNKSPFNPDQNHIHHLLIKKGIPHFGVVIILLIVSLLILTINFLV